MKKRIATLLLLVQGCADITPITDRRAYGPVITLKDWFTSSHLLSYSDGAVLFDVDLRTEDPPARWILRGVCLLTTKD